MQQITRVLDEQGVLSRLKAELRANVFLAISDQDIRRGGIGIAGKSDPLHRKQLLADDAGPLLLQLVREFLQWSNLQFTQQVFEQEVEGLGPTAPLAQPEALQRQLGTSISSHLDQPLLLQLLKHHLSSNSSSSSDIAATSPWEPAAGQQAGTSVTDGRRGSALPSQRRSGAIPAPGAATATHTAVSQQAPALVVSGTGGLSATVRADVTGASGGVGGAGTKAPSKSSSFLGDVSVAEDSGLIGTRPEEAEEEYATILLPKRNISSSDADLDDGTSSTSSTSPADAPRLASRPVRAAAAAIIAPTAAPADAMSAPARQALLPPLQGLAGRPVLPPVAPTASNVPVTHAGTAGAWGSSTNMGSMAAAACELSESFGHDRSFGDSSLELQGLDSPDHRDEQAGNKASTAAAAAAARFSLEASYSSSSSSSASSSRSSSPADEPKQPPAVAAAVAEKQLQVPALPVPGVKAAGVDSLPAVRVPGKLAPLAPVTFPGPAGLSKQTSEGLRDELLKSGLLAPMQQQQSVASLAAVTAAAAEPQQPAAADSRSTSRRGSDSAAAAAAATAAAAAGAKATGRLAGGSGGLGGSGAARASSVGDVQLSGQGSMRHEGQQDADDEGGASSEDSDDDDFGLQGQQQLLAAARRQLSSRSSRSSVSQHHQQQRPGVQQAAGRMQVEVSGASLTLTCSDIDDDDEVIPDDISLPLGDLMEDSGYSAAYEHPVQAAPPASGQQQQQQQAWSMSAPPAAAAAAGAGGDARVVAGGFVGALGAAQQALELTDDESDSEDDDGPLAAAGGFVIDEDGF